MTDRKAAVIYVRVAALAMDGTGDTRAAQEEACRKAAETQGYEVRKVFSDHAGGAGSNTPGFCAMLEFLEQHRAEKPVVFVEHIHRLARSTELLYKLQKEIAAHGGTVHCADTNLARLKDRSSVERERD